MLPLAVLYDRIDGKRFLADRPPVRGVCALTPAAESIVNDCGMPVFSGGRNYGDCAQARTLALRERLLREWRNALPADIAANTTIWYVLELTLATLLHGYDRLRRVIGSEGPWLIPEGEDWRICEKRDEASRAMSRHILARYWHFIGNIVSTPPPFPSLYRLLQRMLTRSGQSRPAWVTSRSDHPLGLERALWAMYPKACQWHFSVTRLGWREYLKVLREIWRVGRNPVQVQICVVPKNAVLYEEQALRAIEALPDQEIRALLLDYAPRIRELCGIAAGARIEFADMLSRIRPNFMLASETADCVTGALFDACGERGIERRIASHNTFGPPAGAINLIALRHLIGHQYAGGDAEQMLFWNPQSLAAAKAAMPHAQDRCGGIRAIAVASTPDKRLDAPFHVLHATNCMRYFSRPSWLFENVNEFVDGAIALVRAGLTVADTTYMVRTKTRDHEMDEELLRARLPHSDRVEIAFRHTRPFVQDLARADLLVAFHSTTIMQALHARKPVLLWGITPRFREFAGRAEPPRPGDRAAVYTVARAEDLADMIAGIRASHLGQPLTDEELEPYVFAGDTVNVEAWARQCSM